MSGRHGNKTRLFMSAKRKKHHFRIKRQTHFAPDTVPSNNENKENSATALNTPSKETQELMEENVSSSSSITRLNDLNIVCENDDDDCDEEISNDKLSGRRIVDIKYLFSSISNIKHQHTDCTFADLKFVKELRKGFTSQYVFRCKMCQKVETVHSEDPTSKLNTNTAIVEGILCSGNGYAQLNEICSVLNMPNMHQNTYTKIEQSLTPLIEECAIEEMIAAGEEEKRLAILNGEIDKEGCPVITVVADGSWAKRSYKSGFSSASGAGCIVGMRTKKVLFLGVRNSYCCICSRSIKLNKDVTEHRCFKNWSDSANAMEADIIAEGFAKSVEMHGIKYKNLVGDGDSSIMKKLLLKKPYGSDFTISKIEC
ncbi:uncharacterized protein LOC123866281 [Maniola jurtina]|uniref:uncharacterized protein LOC123866281 n=1 Tax=Maniola jurtina TaxID=191418 RepID=UPI001E68AAFF|nr:uncharacterized protein LOC123866281 [Maniola jurtina]